MFHVVGKIDPIKRISEDEGFYAYSCTCRDEHNDPAFRDAADPMIKLYVENWCRDNLSFGFLVAGYESVLFANEEDALLFYMSFK